MCLEEDLEMRRLDCFAQHIDLKSAQIEQNQVIMLPRTASPSLHVDEQKMFDLPLF